MPLIRKVPVRLEVPEIVDVFWRNGKVAEYKEDFDFKAFWIENKTKGEIINVDAGRWHVDRYQGVTRLTKHEYAEVVAGSATRNVDGTVKLNDPNLVEE